VIRSLSSVSAQLPILLPPLLISVSALWGAYHPGQAPSRKGAGPKKLPIIKSLQAEYTTLLEEKKAAYTDYRQARDEMKELRTIKVNVDRMLGNEEQEEKGTARREER